jgi:hypothetical protein
MNRPLILAEGYNHELLKSEAKLLEELEEAAGQKLSLFKLEHVTTQ